MPARKADRLYALVDYLRRRRTPVTAPELARRFEVSERTLWRDLAALREQDVPVEGEPGRGGGIRIAPTYSMPPLALRVDEGVALWLACGLASATLLLGGRALPSALDKIVGALPPERRRALGRLASRVLIGHPARRGLADEAGVVHSDVLLRVEEAFVEEHGLSFAYVDRHGKRSRRTVAPHGVLVQPPLWYILAVDVERGVPRMFRLDRIEAIEARPELRFLPEDPLSLFGDLEELAGAVPLPRGRL